MAHRTIMHFFAQIVLKISIALLILRGAAACEHQRIEPIVEPTIVVEMPDSCRLKTLSFAKDIEPMITINCVSSICHNNGHSPRGIGLEGHFALSTYLKNDSARFFGCIKHQGFYSYMPIGLPKLDSCNILKLEIWARQGLPNN
jgi:hypothetical protein